LAFVINSDIAAQAAWWTGAISCGLVFLIMLQICFLRLLLIYRRRRVARLHAEWEPLLVESLEQTPASLPRVSPLDRFELLVLWNYLQESLRDEAIENLNAAARAVKLDRYALDLLEHKNLRKKLLAIQTLGWLREISAGEKLRDLANNDDPVLSLCAARALLRIDGKRALSFVLPLVARRADWSFSLVGGMLKDAGADLISEPLARSVLLIPAEQTPRMLRLLELAHPQAVVPSVRKLLAESSDLETITACLRILQDPEDLPTVRELLKDERWQVRLQAAVCLGKIGVSEDEARLVHACGDLEWWVRYRAAQALSSLPFVSPERLSEIGENHQNEFARDIIRQVIAERKVSG
jgi:hypothetical protein